MHRHTVSTFWAGGDAEQRACTMAIMLEMHARVRPRRNQPTIDACRMCGWRSMQVKAFFCNDGEWAGPAHLLDGLNHRTFQPDGAARRQCGRRPCSAPPRPRTQPPKKARRRRWPGEREPPGRGLSVGVGYAGTLTVDQSGDSVDWCMYVSQAADSDPLVIQYQVSAESS